MATSHDPHGEETSGAATLGESGRTVVILANPRAGAGPSRQVVEELAGRLRVAGLLPVVCWDLDELSARAAARDGLRCVVAAGGDGTVREALSRAPGVPIAVLPLGTENLLARHCGAACSPDALARVIVAGRVRAFDLGRAGERLFGLMAGAGFDAEVVRRMHEARRGHISRLNYLPPIWRALREYPYPDVLVDVEDTGERLRGALAFVFNLPRYGLGLGIGRAARPDDGLLDLVLFEKPGAWCLARYVALVLCGRHDAHPEVRHRRGRVFRLAAGDGGRSSVPLQLDGDPAGFLPVRVEVLPGALPLLVPADGTAGRSGSADAAGPDG